MASVARRRAVRSRLEERGEWVEYENEGSYGGVPGTEEVLTIEVYGMKRFY